MENIFLKYMNERLCEEHDEEKEPGPVITISREFGCYATRIAELVSERLSMVSHANKKAERHCLCAEWHCLSNEILLEAANKLEVDPVKISHFFGADEKNFFGDLVDSFSTKKYASDSNIKMTITNVVKSYAEQGNVIIIGRAGCVIAHHIPKSLHVKIVAPFEWRVRRIQEHFNISELAAKKQTAESDEKRKTFMRFFRGDKPDSELFDIVLNRAKMTEEEIVTVVELLAKARHMVSD